MTISRMLLGAASLAMAAGLAQAESHASATADKRIALSNNYAGNSWRQAMLQTWEEVGEQAVADGMLAAADAYTTAENQATEQAAQIQNMILQGYDAIVLNAANGPCSAAMTGSGVLGPTICTVESAGRFSGGFREASREVLGRSDDSSDAIPPSTRLLDT